MPKTIGTVVDGRFELLKPIGVGGFSEVYLAKQAGLDRLVAIKFSGFNCDAESRMRFFREAKILSSFNHPRIAQFVASGEWQGELYTAIEYVRGNSLQDELDAGPFAGGDVKSLAAKLLDAIKYMHSSGVVHRDLKPANIMLSSVTREPKLIDFGLAKVSYLGQKLTQEGLALGSILYMAPEQCNGLVADERADLYSLGCVLYACITGAPPFMADTAVAVMYQHLTMEPPPINVPHDANMGAFILRLMQKNPADRFQSAADAEEALRDLDPAQLKPFTRTNRKRSKFRKIASACLLWFSIAGMLSIVGCLVHTATLSRSQTESSNISTKIDIEKRVKSKIDDAEKTLQALEKAPAAGGDETKQRTVEVDLTDAALIARANRLDDLERDAFMRMLRLPWHASGRRLSLSESFFRKLKTQSYDRSLVEASVQAVHTMKPYKHIEDAQTTQVLTHWVMDHEKKYLEHIEHRGIFLDYVNACFTNRHLAPFNDKDVEACRGIWTIAENDLHQAELFSDLNDYCVRRTAGGKFDARIGPIAYWNSYAQVARRSVTSDNLRRWLGVTALSADEEALNARLAMLSARMAIIAEPNNARTVKLVSEALDGCREGADTGDACATLLETAQWLQAHKNESLTHKLVEIAEMQLPRSRGMDALAGSFFWPFVHHLAGLPLSEPDAKALIAVLNAQVGSTVLDANYNQYVAIALLTARKDRDKAAAYLYQLIKTSSNSFRLINRAAIIHQLLRLNASVPSSEERLVLVQKAFQDAKASGHLNGGIVAASFCAREFIIAKRYDDARRYYRIALNELNEKRRSPGISMADRESLNGIERVLNAEIDASVLGKTKAPGT